MQAVDITHLFKAGVMTAKHRQKSGGEPILKDKNRIMPKSANKHHVGISTNSSDFAKQARDVCKKITELRNVLLENRSAYLRVGQHLKNSAKMTDEQRDMIDRESEKFITYYTQHIAQMRAEWKQAKRKPQQYEHIEGVVDLLVRYLRSVEKLYLEQKKHRVQYELMVYRMVKLVPDKSKIPVVYGDETSTLWKLRRSSDEEESGNDDDNEDDDGEEDSESDYGDLEAENENKNLNGDDNGSASDASEMDLNDGWQAEKKETTVTKSTTITPRSPKSKRSQHKTKATKLDSSMKVAVDEDMQKMQTELVELTPEEVQILEQENKQLYEQLQGVTHEVEAIEKNVVEIAQLQDIFTEKVSLQNQNIERIANAVVGATENVKDANEQIRQAIQRNAGLRVWSLFFLLVMSFTLLFLDWYYD